jgi:hypothetical protein
VSYTWWMLAFGISSGTIEHVRAQTQVLIDYNLFGSPVPLSILHRGYVVLSCICFTIHRLHPMVAMLLHMFPPKSEEPNGCSCACHREH